MAGCTIIVYFWLPETRGRSPAELDILFNERIPARKFKSKRLHVPGVRLGICTNPFSHCIGYVVNTDSLIREQKTMTDC